MRLREPLLVSVVTVLAMAAPLATVSPAAAAASPPTFVDVVPSKASARTGSTLSIKVIAENEKKSASASHALNFLISKNTSPTGARKVGSGTIPSIAAKTRKSFTFNVPIPSNASAGEFRLLFCHPRTGKPLLCHKDNVKLTISLAPAKLTITPTSHDYGNVATNAGEVKRFTVRNVGRRWSGDVTVWHSGGQASSFGFLGYNCGPSLAPNATCTIDASFNPSATGTFHTSLKVKPSANYSTGAIASLTGTGVTPAQLELSTINDFGSFPTYEYSPAQTVTVTNSGGASTGPVTITVTGSDFEDFVYTDNTCAGVSLAGGASCTVKVKFGGIYPGAKEATFTANADNGGPATAPLTGTTLAPASIAISPNPHNFGAVEIGETATKEFTVTNNGGATSAVMNVNLGGSSWFSLLDNTCSPSGLAAGGSCTFKVQFLPLTADSNTATVSVTGAPTGPVVVNLSGSGATPAEFSFTPSSLNFEDLVVGSTSVKTLTLKNTGGLPSGPDLDFYFNGDGFDIDGPTTTCTSAPLAAGASCTIGVRFEPSEVDHFGGLVGAVSYPPGTVYASVQGNGINPPI